MWHHLYGYYINLFFFSFLYRAAQLFSDSSRGINRKDSHSVTMKDFSNQHGNTQGLSLGKC